MIYKMGDNQYYLDIIKNTNFLGDATKQRYLKRWDTILSNICPKKSIVEILNNPTNFEQRLNKYTSLMRNAQGEPLGDHSKEAFVSPILALFVHSSQLKETKSEIYKQWEDVRNRIRKPINDKYNSNEPTEKQKKAYFPYEDVIKIRDQLKPGSFDRLLLMMYTEIPPVRSDFYQTKIVTQIPNNYEGIENFIVLDGKNSVLILEKYKTARIYGINAIDLPVTLVNEIKLSLKAYPREMLFVSTKDQKPYDKENTFNKWANRRLKQIFQNDEISLTMLRHIYISRRDLKLEEKSGLQREQIARLMGHSIEQQRKYLWHTWLRQIEVGKV